jgi:hypothetical protein
LPDATKRRVFGKAPASFGSVASHDRLLVDTKLLISLTILNRRIFLALSPRNALIAVPVARLLQLDKTNPGERRIR